MVSSTPTASFVSTLISTAKAGGSETVSNHKLNFFVNNGAVSMTIDTAGRVGIGTSTPGYSLDVAGTVQMQGAIVNGTSYFANQAIFDRDLWAQQLFVSRALPGSVPLWINDSNSSTMLTLTMGAPNTLSLVGQASKTSGGTTWSVPSDRRLKQDVREYEKGLDEVLQLRPVRFRYRDDAKKRLTSDHEEIGFIAQEVRAVIPDAVTEGTDGYLSFKADPIHWAALHAIQQLNAKLEMKNTEVQELKRDVAQLKEIVSRLAQAR